MSAMLLDALRTRISGLNSVRRRMLVVGVATAVMVAAAVLLRPGLTSAGGVDGLLVAASIIGFAGVGQTLVVLVGGIDLSIPWVLNSAAIVLSTVGMGDSTRLPRALALALGLGAAAGLANGLGIAVLRIQPVVMTLAVNAVLQGLTLGLTDNMMCLSCGSFAPQSLRDLYVRHVAGIPVELLMWAFLTVLVTVVLSLTTFGRRMRAVGSSARAAFLSGAPVPGIVLAVYTLSGVFSAMAGIALVAYTGPPIRGMGDPYLLETIAAVVIGGVVIYGGLGRYIGVAVGSVVLVATINILSAHHVPEYGRSIIYGLLILIFAYTRQATRE